MADKRQLALRRQQGAAADIGEAWEKRLRKKLRLRERLRERPRKRLRKRPWERLRQ